MKHILGILAITTASYASVIDVDAVRKINEVQSDIQFLKSDEGLSIQSRASLDSLQTRASELAKVLYNKRCERISINSLPDPSCKMLSKKVDKFMETYAKATKRIYISQLATLSKYQDKNEKMQACVEALPTFLNNQASPEKVFPLEISFDGEQIEDNQMKLQYHIAISHYGEGYGHGYDKKTEKMDSVIKMRNQWRDKCREVITYRLVGNDPETQRNAPTRAFIDAANNYYANTNFIFGKIGPSLLFTIGWKKPVKYAILIKNSDNQVVHKMIVEYAFWNSKKYTIDGNKKSPVAWLLTSTFPDDTYREPYGIPAIRLTHIGGIRSIDSQRRFDEHYGTLTLPSDNYTAEIVQTDEDVKIEEWAM